MPRVGRAEFLSVLQRVNAGRAAREFITQSSHFVFMAGAVVTFNDEVFCRTKSGLPPEIESAVRGEELLRVLEALKVEELDLEFKPNELVIKAGRAVTAIAATNEIVLPVDNVQAPDEWGMLPEDFNQAVDQVVPIAGTDRQEYLATCVHLTPDWIEASNKVQAMRYELELPVERKTVVRATSLAHVSKLGMVRIGEGGDWLHFRNKMMVFSCRRGFDEFPVMDRLFEVTGERATLPKAAEDASKLAEIFIGADKDNAKVSIDLTAGTMKVSGSGTFGRSFVPLDMVYTGPNLSFRIAPGVLTDLVRNHTECEIATDKIIVRGGKWAFISALGIPQGAGANVDKIESTEDEPEPQDEE